MTHVFQPCDQYVISNEEVREFQALCESRFVLTSMQIWKAYIPMQLQLLQKLRLEL